MSENNEEVEKLYIPLNVPDTEDFMAGIGSKELKITSISVVIAIIVAIIIYINTNNVIIALFVGAVIPTITVLVIKRDNYQECLLDKLKIVKEYNKTQKQFVYEYYNIYEGDKNESR